MPSSCKLVPQMTTGKACSISNQKNFPPNCLIPFVVIVTSFHFLYLKLPWRKFVKVLQIHINNRKLRFGLINLNILRITSAFSSLEKIPSARSLPHETIYHLSKAQRELGHKLIILAGQGHQNANFEEVDGMKVYRAFNRGRFLNSSLFLFTLTSYPKICSLINKYHINVIHGHGIFTGLAPIIFKKLSNTNVPLIVHCHNTAKGVLTADLLNDLLIFRRKKKYYENRFYLGNYIMWEKAIYNSADAIVAVSNSLKRELMNFYSIPSEKIFTCHNGVDLDLFQRTEASNLRGKIGLKKDEKVVLFVGGIGFRKGFHHLIKAASYIKKTNIPIKILTIGSYGHRTLFKGLMKKYSVQDMFLHVGFVSQKDLPTYYSLADILVLPSIYDTFGNVLVESMACETPVVATAIGGIPEVVEDNINGILVQPRNSRELSDGILELICNDEKRKHLGEAGRKIVERKFTWRQSAERLDSIYSAVLERSHRPIN